MRFIRKRDYILSLKMYMLSIQIAFSIARQIVGIIDDAKDGFNIQLRNERGIYRLSSEIRGVSFIKTRYFLNRVKRAWLWYYKECFK
jgi:hypothetical protein